MMMTWRLSATIPVLFIMMASGFDLRAQTVIENPATPLAKNAGRVVALKEVLRIKDEGEAYYFKYPYNLRVRGDGAIFVQEQEQLLHFDKNGGFVRNYFKKGQGPGEMVFCGDFIPADKTLVVLSSSPPKILWFDQEGSVVKEFAYRSKIQGGMKLVRQTESEYLLSGSDSPFLNLPKSPAISDWIFHLFSLKEGEETIEDRGTFPVQAFIIPSGRGGGGIIPVNSFIAVSAGDGRILLSHTQGYLIKLYDPASNKVTLQFRRSYERVKPDPNVAKRGGVNIGGKSYTSAPVKYTADVTNLFVVGDRFWVVTSTIDQAKGVLIDVFDQSGRYLDHFFLKFPDGSLLKTLGLNQTAVLNGHVFAITLTEDDTYAVVKYRIDDPAAGEAIK
jgi:hypothetical protein